MIYTLIKLTNTHEYKTIFIDYKLKITECMIYSLIEFTNSHECKLWLLIYK